MSTTPPIQYSGPAISPEVPWTTRQHLQLIYQKLGNHTQAMSLLQSNIAKVQGGSTTTNIIEGGSGGGGSTPSSASITVNDRSGQTSYATQPGDNLALLIFDDASAVAVSLTTQTPPWGCFATNLGAGVVIFTPAIGTINGGATFTLDPNYSTIIAFDGTDWFAAEMPIVPASFTAPSHEFFTGYNAATGVFTAAQPAFGDISGNLATSQLPTAGLSVTITTAALTTLGTQGSMTFTNGILTVQVPAT
jgi:hypothetical protein